MESDRSAGTSASRVAPRTKEGVRSTARDGLRAPGRGRFHASMSHPSSDPPTTAGVSHAGR